ncbi:MAG: radical SAM protein, partial [Nitrospirota bacterium]
VTLARRKEKDFQMKNIYFIETKSPGVHIFSRTPLPRLGTILLATILKNRGYNTKVFIEDIAKPDWGLLEDADIICLSSITSTAPRAYQLAKRFRDKGVPVVMGGPHSTFMPEESLLYVDYVVRGEGEETIIELIEYLESGKPLNTIKGLSYRTDEYSIIHNPDRELVSDLDASPVPDFNLVYNWDRKAKIIPIATSRGCPFACRFCSVIPMFGRKYRFKSIDRVIEEIKAVASSTEHIFFIDDNFAADKKRTKALLQAILDNNIKIEWSAQMRTDIARDPELIKLMAKTGCFSVFIGFESINPETLALYNKSQKVEDIDGCIKALKRHSIHIHGMFVLGSDTDDIQTIRDTQRYAKKLDIESIQFMMLTPLPGTPVFEEFRNQGRLLHTDWSKYDAHHAVFEPKLMTAFELHIETLKAMARFYSWGAILRNLWKFDFFYSFIGLYGKRAAKKSLSNRKKYLEHLKEIVITKFDTKTNELRRYFTEKQSAVKNIIINTSALKKNESRFFSTFMKKLGRKTIIAEGSNLDHKGALTIMPIGSEELKTKYQMPSIKMESISLYRACVNIGLLLNIRLKKVRNAYEKALAEIGGTTFECSTILVMVKEK